MKNIKAPYWCPEAVASEKGWHHPKTGELLVAYRGLNELIPSVNVLDESIKEDILDETVSGEEILKDDEKKANLREKKGKKKK